MWALKMHPDVASSGVSLGSRGCPGHFPPLTDGQSEEGTGSGAITWKTREARPLSGVLQTLCLCRESGVRFPRSPPGLRVHSLNAVQKSGRRLTGSRLPLRRFGSAGRAGVLCGHSVA